MTIAQMIYAQLAAAAYRDTSRQNRIDPPAGWQVVLEYPAGSQTTGDGSGFSASAYRGPQYLLSPVQRVAAEAARER